MMMIVQVTTRFIIGSPKECIMNIKMKGYLGTFLFSERQTGFTEMAFYDVAAEFT